MGSRGPRRSCKATFSQRRGRVYHAAARVSGGGAVAPGSAEVLPGRHVVVFHSPRAACYAALVDAAEGGQHEVEQPLARGPALHRSEGTFRGVGRTRLYWCRWSPVQPEPEAPVVVLMHGYGEHCRAYAELAEALVGRGFVVAGFDARGHGRSGGQRGFVARYSDYVEDLGRFVQSTRAALPGRPLALLGHSNGGLIAIRAVQGGLPDVSRLLLCSPAVQLHERRRPVPDWLARGLSVLVGRLPLPSNVAPDALTRDVELARRRAEDPWAHRTATPRWYWSARMEGEEAFRQVDHLVLPTLVLIGGEDTLVEPSAVRRFYELIPASEKRLIVRPEGRHELLNELDRRQTYELIGNWVGCA